MSIPGQVLDTAGNWPIPLGLRARVQSLGWGLTIPVLLRSLDLLPAPTTNTTNNTNTATNTTTAANECSGARVVSGVLCAHTAWAFALTPFSSVPRASAICG